MISDNYSAETISALHEMNYEAIFVQDIQVDDEIAIMEKDFATGDLAEIMEFLTVRRIVIRPLDNGSRLFSFIAENSDGATLHKQLNEMWGIYRKKES